MNDENMVELSAKVQLSPDVLAAAFWNMADDQQAQFFAELHKLGSNFNREMQWYYLAEKMRKPGMDGARDELMSMAAPHYWHTMNARYAA